jgi:hypothetical protein
MENDMPKAQIDSQMWRDPYYQSLLLDESRLFFYLLTCPASNIFGIYQISFDEIAGHNKKIPEKRIKEILLKFETDTKVLYKEGWICFKNRKKYNVQNNESIDIGFRNVVANSPIFIKEFLEKHEIITPCIHGGSNDIEYNKIEYNKILVLWNNSTWRKKVSKLNDDRKNKIKIRFSNKDFDFEKLMQAADSSSDFLKEGNWFTFDWIIKNDTNWRKVVEGNYIDKNKKPIQKDNWKTASDTKADTEKEMKMAEELNEQGN